MLKKERRKFHRIKCHADVEFKTFNPTVSFAGLCVDLSLGGMGINFFSKSTPHLAENKGLEIWIYLSNALKPVHRFGKIVWIKKMAHQSYRGGIKFAPSKTILNDIAPRSK